MNFYFGYDKEEIMIINIEAFIICAFVITVVFLNPLFDNAFIQYADEVFMLYAFFKIFVRYSKIKRSKRNHHIFRVSLVCIISTILIGLLSNLNSNLVSLYPALIDMIGMIKAPIVFIYVACICSDITKEKASKFLVFVAKIYIPIVFAFGIINLVTDIGMTYDIRYGLRTYEFIYRNPAALNEVLFCLLGVIYKELKGKMQLITYSALVLLSVLMTLRGTALGLIAIFMYLFIIVKKNQPFKLKLSHLVVGGGTAFLVGKNQFVEYLIEETPRSIMLRNSFIVLKRYFPFGSGFATYGSDQAFKNYSPLYNQFGYGNIYWLSKEAGYAANDNFWPMVIGQFGMIGLLAYLILLITQFKFVLTNKVGNNEKLIQIVLFAFLLVSSLGNAIFTSVSGMLIYVFIALLMKSEESI